LAITDRNITAIQKGLVKEFGLKVLSLNESDQFFIHTNRYVTGSDVLNTDVWVEYRINNEIPDGFEWRPKDYIKVLGTLGIIGKAAFELEEREARDLKSADEVAYRQVFAGKAIFTAADDLTDAEVESVVDQNYADLSASVKSEFDRKMIEQDFIEEIKRKSDDHTYYIRLKEGREVGLRSMQAQGFKINKKNLAEVSNPAGTRGRFNSFNKNHNGRYASGSWRSGSQAGPRIQGPSGGVGSCKFVIINRSGSI